MRERLRLVASRLQRLACFAGSGNGLEIPGAAAKGSEPGPPLDLPVAQATAPPAACGRWLAKAPYKGF